jgi:hypothetical protein
VKRTPMKRTGWPNKQAMRVLQALDEARPVLHPTPKVTTRAVMVPVSQMPAAPVLKDEPVRSEPYRRLVALFACKGCGIAGYSQAAHPNTGKGMGMKTDDRLCFPLCCTRPGIEGCHVKFDQYRLFGKAVQAELEPVWATDTQRQIDAAGLWPANLPKP